MAETENTTGQDQAANQPVVEPAQPVQTASPFAAEAAPIPEAQAVHWTASEFIAHEKSTGWYLMLFFGALVGAALVYLLTKDKISTAIVLIGAFFLGVYAGRQPRQLEYSLDANGFSIGPKNFSYHQFRSFSIVPEGAFSSIVFMPLKRFAPFATIYYDPNDEDKIVKLISNQLPLEEYKPDPVDNLMRRMRF